MDTKDRQLSRGLPLEDLHYVLEHSIAIWILELIVVLTLHMHDELTVVLLNVLRNRHKLRDVNAPSDVMLLQIDKSVIRQQQVSRLPYAVVILFLHLAAKDDLLAIEEVDNDVFDATQLNKVV